MRKDIFGQDFYIGTMNRTVQKGVYYRLSEKNIKPQKLKDRF
jgi:hypothetical protein